MRRNQGVWASALVVLSALAGCAEKSSAPMDEAPTMVGGSAVPQHATADAREADRTTMPTPITGGLRTDSGASAAANAPKVEMASPDRKSSVMQAFASDVGGKLDAADVQATIDKSVDKLRACITTDSRVSVKVNVLVSGAVGDARVQNAMPNDPKVRDCVAAVLRKLTFPRPKGNEAASFMMDLDLRKQETP